MVGSYNVIAAVTVVALITVWAVHYNTATFHRVPGAMWAKSRDHVTIPRVEANCNPRRMGSVSDGGWWVCGTAPALQSDQKKCLVYSMGIKDDFSFDEAMMKTFGCEVQGFDPSSFGIASKARYEEIGGHFNEIGLGHTGVYEPGQMPAFWNGFTNPEKWSLKSVPDIMRSLKHDKVTVLKIDTEGAEWTSMTSFGANGKGERFWEELMFELHFPPEYGIESTLDGGFTVYRFGPLSDGVDRVSMLRELSKVASLWRWNDNIDNSCCIEVNFVPKIPS